jgi:hypothetical protein
MQPERWQQIEEMYHLALDSGKSELAGLADSCRCRDYRSFAMLEDSHSLCADFPNLNGWIPQMWF